MSYRKSYANYFKIGKFDDDSYIYHMLLDCITNNIKEPKECCALNNVDTFNIDYNTLTNKFNEVKKQEPKIIDCINNNVDKIQCIYYCKNKDKSDCFKIGLWDAYEIMFDNIKKGTNT